LENNHKLVWLTQNWIWFSRSKSEYFVWKFYLKLDSSSIYVWNQNCCNLFFRTGIFFIKVKNRPTLVLIHSSSRIIRSNYHLALVFYPYVGRHYLFSHFEVCVWDTIVNGFYDDTLEQELCCEVHFETKSLKCLKLFEEKWKKQNENHLKMKISNSFENLFILKNLHKCFCNENHLWIWPSTQ
jgi:hypothetical protein